VPHRRKSPSLIGKAKELEVAGVLISHGLYVFFPLVDAGFDLVVTNRAGAHFVPVQVKFRAKDPALGLLKKDRENFEHTDVVIAWVIGLPPNTRVWFIPYQEWKRMATTPKGRRDGLAYITIRENEARLAKFEGETGIRRAHRKRLWQAHDSRHGSCDHPRYE
jgi:hypothetical protein